MINDNEMTKNVRRIKMIHISFKKRRYLLQLMCFALIALFIYFIAIIDTYNLNNNKLLNFEFISILLIPIVLLIFMNICVLNREKQHSILMKEINHIYNYSIDSSLKARLIKQTILFKKLPVELPDALAKIHLFSTSEYTALERVSIVKAELKQQEFSVIDLSVISILITCSTNLISNYLGIFFGNNLLVDNISNGILSILLVNLILNYVEKQRKNKFIFSIIEDIEKEINQSKITSEKEKN